MTCAACGERMFVPLQPPPHPVPWEDRRRNAFRRWWQTYDKALFSPQVFFKAIPYEGGHKPALRFVVFFYLQFFMALAVLLPIFSLKNGKPDQVWKWVGIAVLAAPFFTGLMIALLYLFGAIDHFCLRLLGGKGTFEATLRVIAYSYPTVVVRSLPYVGKILHPLWSLWCLTHGFAAAHRLTKKRAFFGGLLGSGLSFFLIFAAGFLYGLFRRK